MIQSLQQTRTSDNGLLNGKINVTASTEGNGSQRGSLLLGLWGHHYIWIETFCTVPLGPMKSEYSRPLIPLHTNKHTHTSPSQCQRNKKDKQPTRLNKILTTSCGAVLITGKTFNRGIGSPPPPRSCTGTLPPSYHSQHPHIYIYIGHNYFLIIFFI